MESKKNKNSRGKLCTVTGCILVILLCTAPCGALNVLEGDPPDVSGVVDELYVEGTANLLPGAEVLGLAWVARGGTLNIYPGAYMHQALVVDEGCIANFYGGGVGWEIYVTDGLSPSVVTVYGKYFELVEGTPYTESEFIPDPDTGSLLMGRYENDDVIDLVFSGPVPIHLVLVDSVPEVMEVVIDIRPYCGKNVIDLNCKDVVPVAVLTTDVFDAAAIDPATVVFAEAMPIHWVLKDVDRDGDKDMLFCFKTQDLNLDQDSTEATLTGQTVEEVAFQGTDEVRIVPAKKQQNKWGPCRIFQYRPRIDAKHFRDHKAIVQRLKAKCKQ
jgi:hypothetical protein